MTVFGWIVTSIGTLFLLACLVRIYQYFSTHTLQSDTCMTLLLVMGFFTGLTYMLGNYEIQRILHSYVSFIPLPVSSILWLISGIILSTHVYILALRKYSSFDIPMQISYFLLSGVFLSIVVGTILYNRVPFYRLQVIIALFGSVMALVSAIVIFPMMRAILIEEEPQIYGAQFRWFVIEIMTLFVATVLLAIDSIYKLWFDIQIIYTPTFVLTFLFHTTAIIALHNMNEGHLTDLVLYPNRLYAYFKLKKLYQAIQNRVQFPDAYNIPVPDVPFPNTINLLLNRMVMKIADRYAQLAEDDMELRLLLKNVMEQDLTMDTMIARLIGIPCD
jgi:hypothetical protein